MFPLIELSGSARARGEQHGRKASAQIRRSIATYARLFAYCGIDWSGEAVDEVFKQSAKDDPAFAHTDTIAEEAMLEIETASVTVWCRACEIETEVAPNALLCGSCGTWQVDLRSGNMSGS